jgi:2-polyprenyl-3-methyl-5-hydroxy-6-metoxy-1,4-benzoquinol methylase
MRNDANIYDERYKAAISSKGISGNHISKRIFEILDDLNHKGSVLDFGAGIGNISLELIKLKSFKKVYSIDILPKPDYIPDNIHWYEQDLNEKTSFPDKMFDLIISPEVIEHLENPRAVAREWFRLISDSGTLIFSTPNNHSWRSIFHFLVKDHFVGFADSCYPAHITALTKIDISRILLESGFKEINFYYTNYGGLPKFPKLTWQKISFGILKGKRFSDNIICVARK